MRRLDYQYLIRKMMKGLWIALLVGALLSGAMYIKNRGLNPAPAVHESLTYSNYKGDYISNVYATRYIILDIRFNEKSAKTFAEEAQSRGAEGYSWEYANIILQRFLNANQTYRFYQVLAEYPEIKANEKYANYNLIGQMVKGYVDRSSALILTISSPDFAKAQLSAGINTIGYRDSVYQKALEIIESGELFGDLPVTVIRADPATEAIAEEQDFLMNAVQDTTAYAASVSLKQLLIFFVLGFVATELIILLIGVLNPTVKSDTDLKNNTDLEVLDVVSDWTKHEWDGLAEKLRINASEEKEVIIWQDRSFSETDWETVLGKAAEKRDFDLRITAIRGTEFSAETLRDLAETKILLAVKKGKTHYSDLKKLSDTLRQIKAQTIGAILEE